MKAKFVTLALIILIGAALVYGCGKGAQEVGVGVLAEIIISPQSPVVASGSNIQFTAIGRDSAGNSISITPVWEATGGVGTIDPSGLFTATRTGKGTVKASSQSTIGTTGITVTSGILAAIDVSPNPVTVELHSLHSFTAIGKDSYGNKVTITPSWSASEGIGTITQNGNFYATAIGSGLVTASSNGIQGSSNVTVTTDLTPPSAPTGLSITVGSGTLYLNWYTNTE